MRRIRRGPASVTQVTDGVSVMVQTIIGARLIDWRDIARVMK